MKILQITRKILAAAFLVMFVTSPTYAFAALSTTTSTSTRPDTSVRGVCLRVVSLEDSLNQKLTTAGRMYAKVSAERTNKLKAQAIARGSEDLTARKDADKKFITYIASLHAKANGDFTKDLAITTFSSTVTDATLTRRISVDDAQKIFMTGVQALADARFEEVTKDAATLQADIQTALASAKSSCINGKDPKIVRNTLHLALASIDSRYRSIFMDQSHFVNGLQTLASARSRALTQANKVFSASLDEASQAVNSVLQ